MEEQKTNFIKNRPQWGWNPGPLDHQSNALPIKFPLILEPIPAKSNCEIFF